MKKFSCGCGKNVRDVYYKNGQLMCVKCFTQSSEHPHDYIINMLAEKGLVITFQNQPVLVIKQFSADLLDQAEELVRPTEDWFILSGDEFWSHFNGSVENLRAYITEYGQKKETEEQSEHGHSHQHAQPAATAHDCSTCTSCSGHDED